MDLSFSFSSWEAASGTNLEADMPAGQARDTQDRYGDVPLGVESAWPTAALPVTP
jgi:hypothetical protein